MTTSRIGRVSKSAARWSDDEDYKPSKRSKQKPAQEPRAYFSAEEDAALLSAVKKLGNTDWRQITEVSGLNRSPKSIRSRYYSHLAPGIDVSAYRPEEDKFILEMYEEFGSSWSLIAASLPGRTNDSVKNRFNSTLRKQAGPLAQPLVQHVPLEQPLEKNLSEEEMLHDMFAWSEGVDTLHQMVTLGPQRTAAPLMPPLDMEKELQSALPSEPPLMAPLDMEKELPSAPPLCAPTFTPVLKRTPSREPAKAATSSSAPGLNIRVVQNGKINFKATRRHFLVSPGTCKAFNESYKKACWRSPSEQRYARKF